MKVEEYRKKLKSLFDGESPSCAGVRLDFSNPEHRNFYMDSYGGEQYLKENFPTVYKAVLNTAEKSKGNWSVTDVQPYAGQPVITKRLNLDGTDGGSYDDDDWVSVKSGVWVHPNKNIPWLRLSGVLVSSDPETPRLYDSTSQKFRYSENPPEEFKLELDAPKAIVKKNKRAGIQSICTLDSANTEELTLSRTISVSPICYVNGYADCVKSITVVHPRSIKSPPNVPIKVMYGNRVNSTADYSYKDIHTPQDEKVMVMTPIEVKIEMEKDFAPMGPAVTKTYPTVLEYVGSTVAVYNNTAMTITHSGNTITATFPEDWKCLVTGTVFKSGMKALLTCPFYYKIHDPDDPEGVEMAFVLLSDPMAKKFYESTKDTQVFIPDLVYSWGCFAADTLIRMADGSCRPIREIQPGDLVKTYQNGNAHVRNIITGKEERLIHFETVDGKKLRVSAMHPVLTARGMLQAREISILDKLIAEDGSQCPIRFLYDEDYRSTVYSLEFDEPASVFAQGIVSGDFESESQLQPEPPQMLSEEAERLLRELDELDKLFPSS